MRLVPERDPLPRLLAFPYLVIAAGFGLVLLIAEDRVTLLFYCPWQRLTGLPCPTCGGTRAALALMRGAPADAWHASPLVTAAALALAIWGVTATATTLVPRWRFWVALSPAERRFVRVLACTCFLGAWVYKLAGAL